MSYPIHPIIDGKEDCLIPLDIIADVLSETKRINMLRVYLYINARSKGTMYLTPDFRRAVGRELDITPRHIRTCLRWLECDFGWIGCLNRKAHHFVVRGFRKIQERRDDPNFQSVILDMEDGTVEEKEKFEAFLFGGHIGGIARRKKYIYFRKSKTQSAGEESLYGSLKNGSKPSPSSRPSFYWPVAALYVAKSLGISISTAAVYRQAAADHGFIEIKRYRRALTAHEREVLMVDDEAFAKRVLRSRGRLMLDGIHGVRCGNLRFRRMTSKQDEEFSRLRVRHIRQNRKKLIGFVKSSVPSTASIHLEPSTITPF